MQPFRRTAEVELLGDRDEIPQQPQLHAPNDTPAVLARGVEPDLLYDAEIQHLLEQRKRK